MSFAEDVKFNYANMNPLDADVATKIEASCYCMGGIHHFRCWAKPVGIDWLHNNAVARRSVVGILKKTIRITY